jgi:hypothetical protein
MDTSKTDFIRTGQSNCYDWSALDWELRFYDFESLSDGSEKHVTIEGPHKYRDEMTVHRFSDFEFELN